MSTLATDCGTDIKKFCKGLNLGNGRIQNCLEEQVLQGLSVQARDGTSREDLTQITCQIVIGIRARERPAVRRDRHRRAVPEIVA